MLRRHIENVHTLLLSREKEFQLWGKRLALSVAVLVIIFIGFVLSFSTFFGPAGTESKEQEFLVHPGDTTAQIADALQEAGLVRNAIAFRVAYTLTGGTQTMRPGGYELSPSMDTLALVGKLKEAPYLAWIVIPEGLRKEQVGELLAENLSWSATQVAEWLVATKTTGELSEGVFYADIYLIPSDQSAEQIAERMRSRFEEAVAPYVHLAEKRDLTWNEVIILASLIEREAAKNDKPLVAGILQNRIKRGMLLQVDATLQYVEGREGSWWPVPNADDKYLDSPYNTYMYGGLPPEPIATPSMASILAVLEPDTTKCLYYIHDAYGRIHCSTNYQAHVANVKRYLR